MTLTYPLSASEIRLAFPSDTRGLGDGEVRELLELEEIALRATFGVTSTAADADVALSRAMRLGWLSFRRQLSQVTRESIGTTQASTEWGNTLNWPPMVNAALRDVRDATVDAWVPARGLR